LWRGNWANVLRYFPTQAFNLSLKDSIKGKFPVYNPKSEFGKFFMVNMLSATVGASLSMAIIYPLDFARTRLATDLGDGKKTYNGISDCLMKTYRANGVLSIYHGFCVSVSAIALYRGIQLGLFDTMMGLNPY
jgi:solute carrier family 25 (mitochondrial adenine nucleotide translocator), member 4/5/6/31